MKFIYTFRDEKGTVKTGTLDASNRSELFSVLKEKNIQPISVKTGDASPSTTGTLWRGKKVLMETSIGLLTFAIILVLAVLLQKNPPQKNTFHQVKSNSVKAKAVISNPKRQLTNQVPTIVHSSASNTPPKDLHVQLNKEERLQKIARTIQDKDLNLSTRTNRAFRTSLEQTLAAIFTTPLGAPPPMLPMRVSNIDWFNIQKILDAPNEILETDSEKVVDAKQTVEEAKKVMKEYIKNGETPSRFLEYYYGELKMAHDEWKSGQLELVKTMKTDPGLAASLEAEINERLKAKGIRPVKMPPKLKERYGIE